MQCIVVRHDAHNDARIGIEDCASNGARLAAKKLRRQSNLLSGQNYATKAARCCYAANDTRLAAPPKTPDIARLTAKTTPPTTPAWRRKLRRQRRPLGDAANDAPDAGNDELSSKTEKLTNEITRQHNL